MDELRITRDAIGNCGEITAIAERHRHLFADFPDPTVRDNRPASWEPLNPYRDSEYEDDDRYHVLQVKDMPEELRAAVVRGFGGASRDLGQFYFQINRYDTGDYILPHRDTADQGVYMLTDSAVDGLVVQSGPGSLEFVADQAGTLVEQDRDAWHWVDPVQGQVRYTLVTIPALPRSRRAPA